MPGSEPVLEARHVSKTYSAQGLSAQALLDVSLEVFRSEIVAVVGPSGCGKTTLLHCLSGLETVDAGQVLVEGQDLARLSDGARSRHRARRLGFVFQSFNLLPVLSARENIELPLLLAGRSPRDARRRADDLLETLGLADRAGHRPAQLSGGQQQRVAVARAVAVEPAVIFADEPTGNLDTASARQVLDLLQDLNERLGQTIVVVTHATEVAQMAGRIVEMRDGQIVGARDLELSSSTSPAGALPVGSGAEPAAE